MVSNAPSLGSWSILSPASQGGPSLPGRVSDMAPQTSCSAALGLAPSHSQGLDEAVLKTIGNARAPANRAKCDQKRRVFSTWCHNRQEDPVTCPIELVLRFLQSLLYSERSTSTIKVYTAAIALFHETVGGVTVGTSLSISGH